MINTISITHVIVYAACTRLQKLIVIYLDRPLTNVLKEGQTIFPSIPKEIPLRVLVLALVSHPRSSTNTLNYVEDTEGGHFYFGISATCNSNRQT